MKKTHKVVPFRTKQGVTMTLGVFEPRDNEIWVKPKRVAEAWVAYDYLLDELLKDGFADEEEVDDWAADEVRLQRSIADPSIWKTGMAFCFNDRVDWEVAEQCKIPVAVLEGKEVLFLPGDYYTTLDKIIVYQGG